MSKGSWLAAIATVVVTVGLILWTQPARSHEAPTGWSYSSACCNNRDCHPEPSKITATDQGWHIARTGETIPYSSRKIKVSQDGDFHRCQYETDIDTLNVKAGQTRCLYVPPQGF